MFYLFYLYSVYPPLLALVGCEMLLEHFQSGQLGIHIVSGEEALVYIVDDLRHDLLGGVHHLFGVQG